MLSLVLLQSRSYGDIASLLRLGESDVRERAHAAAGQLVRAESGPEAETRARIIDYMLGEQTVSARAQTRSELESSDVARTWALQLAEGLAPLAKSPLPSIPDPPVVAAPPAEPVKPAAPPKPSAGSTTPAMPRKPAAPADPPKRPRPAAPSQRARITPGVAPSPRGPLGPRDRGLPLGQLTVAGAVAVIAIIALVIVLASSGGGANRSARLSTVATTTGATGTGPGTSTGTGTPTRRARTIEKLVLQPVGSNRRALGAGAVVQQKDGTLLLLVQARGLIPNSQHNAYAVWLVNSPGDANLLGFVKPAVGASGAFSSGAQLPSDASRFHSLLVTLERSSQPASPGPVVLRTPLSLP